MKRRNIVFTTSDLMEAHLKKSLLESEGIEVFLFDDNISRMNPLLANAVGGIKLVVPDEDVSQAKEILQENTPTDYDGEPVGKLSPFSFLGKTKGLPLRLLSIALIVAAAPIGFLAARAGKRS